MRDREAARPEKPDGGIDVVVVHARRVVELNHAIDSPRNGRREWRRRLRQLLRLRRKRRSFFIQIRIGKLFADGLGEGGFLIFLFGGLAGGWNPGAVVCGIRG